MKFELIGVLMGIAIFNRVILDLHFPMIAYGKILGRKPTIESLEEYMPVGCWVVWLPGWLVDWLVGLLIGWLIVAWLIGLLFGYLNCLFA